MTRLCKSTFVLLAVTVQIGCDQAAKFAAREYIYGRGMQSFFFDLLRLQYVENRGGLLGLGADMPQPLRTWLFGGGVGLALCGLLGYCLLNAAALNIRQMTGWSLVLGGGFSNLLDRLSGQGTVIDFINLGIGNLRTGIFNPADVAIVLGMLLLFLTLQGEKT
jgi:signal peptidase II